MGSRSSTSIVKATALEILSEPLTLLVTLAALALCVFAPTFHYHQFGEATRMARDAGLSAAFTGGLVLAVFGTIRAFRREIESGTLEMALSHPVSRCEFFVSKTAGSFLAFIVFEAIVFGTTLAMVEGAAVGGRMADRTGDIARIWGPCVAAGVAVILVPLVVGAFLNRCCRVRFVLSALISAAILACAFGGYAVFMDHATLLPYFPAMVPALAFALVFVSASAAFAVRFKPNAAAACAGVLFAATLPFAGNYYLADSLSHGGSVSFATLSLSVAAAIPAIAAFLILGVKWTKEKT